MLRLEGFTDQDARSSSGCSCDHAKLKQAPSANRSMLPHTQLKYSCPSSEFLVARATCHVTYSHLNAEEGVEVGEPS